MNPMNLFNSSISLNPLALIIEELCRNCSTIVEDEFIKGELNHPTFKNLDTIFGARQFSSYASLCLRCAEDFDRGEPLFITMDLEISDMPTLKIYAGQAYTGIVKKLIRKVKYDDDRLVADALGIRLADAVGKLIAKGTLKGEMIENAILIPVPLHKTRKRKRGYNQAELVARKLERRFSCKIRVDILDRVLNTKPQFDLDLQTRKTNVTNAFKARVKELDPNRSYIIVDDVFTTGATIKACAKELVSVKAKNIIALTAACAV